MTDNRDSYFQRREVNHAVYGGVFVEERIESLLVCDRQILKGGSLSTQKLDAIDGLDRGVVEIVGDDDFIAGLEQGKGSERPNVASSAGYDRVSEESIHRR